MAKKPSTAVAEKPAEDDELMLSQEEMGEFAEDSGSGMETAGSSDFLIPFMTILQSNSPQVLKRHEEYVDGAEAGMIFNTATSDLAEEIIFIPSMYQRRYTEWRPRDNGGGLVRDWGSDASRLAQCKRDEKTGRDMTPDGNNLVVSGTWYGVIYPTMERVIIAMSSTQLKKSRGWLSKIQKMTITDKEGNKRTPPLFLYSWKLSTIGESNEKGDWFGWKIDYSGPTPKLEDGRMFYEAAKSFNADVKEGVAQISTEQTVKALGSDSSHMDDEIPF